jgi:orotidine-5'-phosphate decarboxylase
MAIVGPMQTFMSMLKKRWNKNQTMLCVGLDTDLQKIPGHLKKQTHPIFEFNRQIIEATSDLVCAYKPQIAYYSAQAAENELKMTIDYIKKNHPEIPVILDSKRGDIGDTAEMYAREAFEVYGAHAVTVNPYMGGDTLQPFLKYKDRGVIVLCKTSNPGSGEIQNRILDNGKKVFELVAEKAATEWNSNNNVAIVVGATHIEELAHIRKLVGDLPFLVPGVGAQGGDTQEVVRRGRNSQNQGLMISSSRAVIYASREENFAEEARQVAMATCRLIKDV